MVAIESALNNVLAIKVTTFLSVLRPAIYIWMVPIKGTLNTHTHTLTLTLTHTLSFSNGSHLKKSFAKKAPVL